MKTMRRRFLLAAGGLTVLAACSKVQEGPVQPAEIESASTCDLDGMLLADYPGPKAQIFYAGDTRPHWFCDTVEMFHTLLKPEQARPLRAVFVQDMALAEWESPRGHWFDATTGVYVFGSKRRGPMGPAIASFRDAAGARAFMDGYGGKMLAYAEVTTDMVDICGGASNDGRM